MKYEYKTEIVYNKSSDELEVWLNEQGQEEWELIQVKQIYGSDDEEYLFKRDLTKLEN